MDYNFISVGDFRILEESGLLLESGTYDGGYHLDVKDICARGCMHSCRPFTLTALYTGVTVSSIFTVIMS